LDPAAHKRGSIILLEPKGLKWLIPQKVKELFAIRLQPNSAQWAKTLKEGEGKEEQPELVTFLEFLPSFTPSPGFLLG
jgi:hypothetical protein